jgi:hypothetical protein
MTTSSTALTPRTWPAVFVGTAGITSAPGWRGGAARSGMRKPLPSWPWTALAEHRLWKGPTSDPGRPDNGVVHRSVTALLLSPGMIEVHDAWARSVHENHSIWRAGSPAAGDVRAVASADSESMTKAYEYTMLLLASASDHLRAIADLLAPKHGFLPSFTLARALLEASARAWYLLDPDIGCDERLRRYVNERLSACVSISGC